MLDPEFHNSGKRLSGKIETNSLICQIDKIILNEQKEKRLRVESQGPIKWRFGVG